MWFYLHANECRFACVEIWFKKMYKIFKAFAERVKQIFHILFTSSASPLGVREVCFFPD